MATTWPRIVALASLGVRVSPGQARTALEALPRGPLRERTETLGPGEAHPGSTAATAAPKSERGSDDACESGQSEACSSAVQTDGRGTWRLACLVAGARPPSLGLLGLASFISIAEAWPPLYEAVVRVRQGRRKWVKPPGFGIALYGIGSIDRSGSSCS